MPMGGNGELERWLSMVHGGLIREKTVGHNFLHGDLDKYLEYEFIDLEAKPVG